MQFPSPSLAILAVLLTTQWLCWVFPAPFAFRAYLTVKLWFSDQPHQLLQVCEDLPYS